jgi:hypothetical protein
MNNRTVRRIEISIIAGSLLAIAVNIFGYITILGV